MNKMLWSCAAIFTLFVGVECLTCRTCDVSVLGSCVAATSVTCTAGENRCYSAVAKFSASLLDIHQRGCINDTACQNTNGSILSVSYTITRDCCSTNLCNGAPAAPPTLAAALCAALLAVWSQWVL